jgi:dephospho-CoA kinase
MKPTGLVVGLTGGIGSGKSAAADVFARLGAAVVDSDRIAHALTGPGGAAMVAIADRFGREVIAADGGLDRAAMRQRVFADPAQRSTLEALLHPLIRDASDRQGAQACLAGAPYVVLVVPLLVESADFRQRVDRVLVVDADIERCIERVAARSGLSREEVLAIVAAQASRPARLAVADDVIANDGTLADLTQAVETLHARYLALAAACRHAD